MSDPNSPKAKPRKSQDPLKIAGAVFFVVGSFAMVVHKLPSQHYVDAHPDKPVARAAAQQAPAKSAAFLAAKILPKVAAAQPRAGQVSRASMPQASGPMDESSLQPVVDWKDSCSAEIGILCYGLAPARLPRCLSAYREVLRTGCRDALRDTHRLTE